MQERNGVKTYIYFDAHMKGKHNKYEYAQFWLRNVRDKAPQWLEFFSSKIEIRDGVSVIRNRFSVSIG